MIPGRRLDDLDRDIRDHLERETQAYVERGMTEDEARYAARRAFGNVTLAMEETRAVWIPVWFDQLLQDVRYGLRMLRRAPGFSAVVILTLALGIGLNTAVFSVFDAVLLRPLPYPAADRLLSVSLYGAALPFGMEAVGSADVLRWREQATSSFEKLAAYDTSDQSVVTADSAEQARIAWVTDDLWDIAGARVKLGRLPHPGERDALLLSHEYFSRRFRGDANVVGSSVLAMGRQVTIIGVIAKGFLFELPGLQRQLVPAPVDGYRSMVISPGPRPASLLLNVVARLKPGATIARARAELEAVRAGIAQADPFPLADRSTLRVMPMQERIVGESRAALRVLLAAVIVVLLIASANIANLLLARASARQKEIAIRASMGAGGARLLRQFAVESGIIALAGGGAGVWFARAGLIWLERVNPLAIPRLAEASIDGRVLVFALSASVVTAILFGVGPALGLRRVNVHHTLKENGRLSPVPGHLLLRRILVAVEVALALILICGAGLMVKSVWRMRAHPDGFVPDQIVVMKMRLSGPGYATPLARRAYADEVLARLRTQPGVQAAGITTNVDALVRMLIEGEAPIPNDVRSPPAVFNATSAGFLPAMGLRLLKGRWITDSEPRPAVVINESAAQRALPGQDPIGKRLMLPTLNQPLPSPVPIVGVVADLKYSKLDARPEPEIYIPYVYAPTLTAFSVVARAGGDPAALTPSIRSAVAGIDKTLPVFGVMTLEQVLTASIAPRRFNLFLLGIFAGSALLLAVIGIYGVIAFSVAQRTHEIGVRLALGAQRRAVVGMVVWQCMAVVLGGIAVGVAGALALTRVMMGMLYDVAPTDPPTFAIVTGLLAATALAACAGPALKAALVDPVVALRCE